MTWLHYCFGVSVTSHCTQEGHFSIAVSRNVTSPPLHLDSVHLTFQNDSGCDPVMTTHAFVLFQFPFTSCGTTRWVRSAGQGLCSWSWRLGGKVLVTSRDSWNVPAMKG
jgi:hypothetical protein